MAKDKKTQKIVLLDSHAIIHRGYHALPNFFSSKGIPTGALYGLSSMLIGILEKFKPDYIIACYDLPQATYRHEVYEGYKAQRKKTDDDLVEQIKLSRKIFEAFNIPIYDKGGFEADDILGTIVHKLTEINQKNKSEKYQVIIASGDMDTLQLVKDEEVIVYTLKKGIKDTILYDEKAVVERFGFLPKSLPDYKGLRGDTSDNIIGIAGIGEKTAGILISHFGSIEKMYEKIHDLKSDSKGDSKKYFKELGITDRVYELLKNGEEEAVFSKMLATIRRDAPIEFKIPEKTWYAAYDLEKIENIFEEFEFRSLIGRVKNLSSGYDFLSLTSSFGADAGTGASAKTSVETSAKTSAKTGTKATGAKASKKAIAKEDLVIHNVPEEKQKKLKIALWVLNSTLTNPSFDDVLRYARTKDADTAEKYLLSEIKKQGLDKILNEIELPLIPVVEEMEKWGIKIDIKYLKNLSKEYHKALEKLEKEIWEMAGKEFNISSPKQLSEVLFDQLALDKQIGTKRIKKTSTGVRSTKESELEKMIDTHPIVPKILEQRELAKLLSTYIDNIPELVDENQRLHASFLQTGTTTGRMSSQNPNLQNIPIKTELGRRVRQAIISDDGYKLVSFDYSQIELRIAAFLSKDPVLMQIFKDGIDVHTGVAAKVFHVDEGEVTKDMRRKAKIINFGILYGMGVNALKQNLNSSREEAQSFYNEYFKTFSRLAEYLDETKMFANQNGYTETFWGRKRYFEGIRSKLPFIKAAAERMAINAPIQGTSADIIKLSMSKIYDFLHNKAGDKGSGKAGGKLGGPQDIRMLLQVHDELVFEIKEDLVHGVYKEIQKIMQDAISIKETDGVPIVTSANIGDNWNEMSAIKEDK